MNEGIGGRNYALGHSQRELKRLSLQAAIFEPFTRRMLGDAGVSQGMRVLDVGCGTGDVSFLVAASVGPAGEVIGVDRSDAAVGMARERAREGGIGNVTFAVGDPLTMEFDKPFDALVGRLVLMHQPDPAALLRRLSRLVRSGGIVAFQEFDTSQARTVPPTPTLERCMQWLTAAFAAAGGDANFGPRLYPVFVEASLPGPSMSMDTAIWGGDNNPGAIMVSDVMRSLLPMLVKSGIATEEEVGADTVQERIQQEILAVNGVAISPALVGAWTRIP